MTFVTLKTGSKERRLGKQVPTTEPATGADGSVLIYVRCDRAVVAKDVYKILRDEEGFFVAASDPAIGHNLCFHVGMATEAAAVGDYIPFVIRGLVPTARFPANLNITGSNEFVKVHASGSAVFGVESAEGHYQNFAHVAVPKNSRTHTEVTFLGEELYI